MRPSPSPLLPLLASLALWAGAATGVAAAAEKAEVKNPHGSFRAECNLCHGESGWTPARISRRFDHGKFGFPLEGAHAAAGCRACHASLDFAKAPTACLSCHEDVHRGELGVACERCHTTRSFIDRIGMVRMHRTTRFPLIGSHAAVDCEGCHRPEPSGHLRFTAMSVECVSCHLTEYQRTTNPNHAASGFPTDCGSCHRMSTWAPARFDHAATGFPLTGAHKNALCESCHKNNVFTGLSTACASCHQGDYDGTTDPNHASIGFPITCADCHTTASWAGATFDHAATGFALTGAHASLQCGSCHTGGVYTGLNPACASCHQSDYNATSDPAHAAAGFPVTCADCHTTSNWNANYTQHDSAWFPIYSGAHLGRWTRCSDCHTQNTDYSVFMCLACHPHDDKASTDSHHTGVSNYQYVSSACYSCHPRGRAG
ncbi:MAG TPA: cytochrome c3 family protein [Candidatus Eisenbacteria bacterium]